MHARSAFLQGLFFLDPETLHPHFAAARSRLRALRELARAEGIGLGALLLNYAVQEPLLDRIVIGVTRVAELEQNLDAGTVAARCAALRPQLDAFACADEAIILPNLWKLT